MQPSPADTREPSLAQTPPQKGTVTTTIGAGGEKPQEETRKNSNSKDEARLGTGLIPEIYLMV